MNPRCCRCNSRLEQDDIVFYCDDEKKKRYVVCRCCDEDIQWLRNPLWPIEVSKIVGSFK